jgi:hypothetical protein
LNVKTVTTHVQVPHHHVVIQLRHLLNQLLAVLGSQLSHVLGDVQLIKLGAQLLQMEKKEEPGV